ncbi:hypothetical protein GCM10009716_02150 [Streptomyces sodiiphilus]|uniref:Uncharacterized protein n=1 Tax=Streptomyces sodiiphilus TaxID=226217 RepID=A0ABN2NRM8_9ACTN
MAAMVGAVECEVAQGCELGLDPVQPGAVRWQGEPELTPVDFDTLTAPGGTDHPNLDATARATGHDGILTGTYLNGPHSTCASRPS